MPAVLAEELQTAIINTLDGTHSNQPNIREFGPGTYVYGGLEGNIKATQAKALDLNNTMYVFDVIVGTPQTHEASPVSRNANHKIIYMNVSIPIWRHLMTTPEDDVRRQDRAEFVENIDLAIQALTYPGNLTQDGDSTATNIMGGMLMGPGGVGDPIPSEPEEDWDAHLLTARIDASALMKVTQPTA
jgi:hypothetical protein